ncbi:dihydrolipoyl dehydrogenase [Candidatus Uabimicrobium amorphum]|uniref:Dihydrolipoyl dehydrogenase n=1 Tax=Uabimicrobium amorphum TaxID=2596890 RepID=A0A5S9IMY5_UABAM|nr:dihydrolipoyl dehydrogenase [Candidatus Uabimicrobium amorphum]BBM84868.1 dihydrolipoyl dehydrogenase [Candidatus Uabimicrobium amorphum]
MAEKIVDTLIIGGGPGGYVAAIRLGQLGVKTLVVDKDRAFGGVCLNWGCIPSKSLIQMAGAYDKAQNLYPKMGVMVDSVSVDWPKTQQWKNSIIQTLTKGISGLLKGNGVDQILGTATLTSAFSAEIEAQDGEKHSVKFKNAIIATGSRPRTIPGFEFDHESILDSTDLLELMEIPKSLILIGGGVIGLELGTVYAKLGAKLTVIEVMDQLLPNIVSKDVANVVHKKLKKKGADIHLNARAKSWKKVGKQVEVTFECDGKEHTAQADFISVAVGRSANVDSFGAEKAGITIENGFIKVDDQLRTSQKHIFAIGDVVGQPMLAHKASKEGEIAAENIHGENYSTDDIQAIPSIIFTDPEIATVGVIEDKAQKDGLSFKTGKFPYAASGRARSTGETDGFVKVIAEQESEIVLGVEMVGGHASDLIAEAGLAIEMTAELDDLSLTVHPHPTLGELIMEAAKVAKGEPIHTLPKK